MTGPAPAAAGVIVDDATRGLRAAIAADPLARRRVCVVAPGGHGKTVLLTGLAEVYRDAGVLVVDSAQAVTDLAGREPAALVVDDAHRLGDTQLAELLELVAGTPLPVVLAYRPAPRRPALAELAEALDHGGTTLTPAPFDRDQVARLLAERIGAERIDAERADAERADAERADELATFVHAQTGGVPRFVDRLATALAADTYPCRRSEAPKTSTRIRVADDGQGDGAQEVPEAAVLAMRPDLDVLDDDARRYLLAVEAGAGLHLELLSALLGRDATAAGEIMAAVRATGLLGEDGALLPISRLAVRALLPVELRAGVRQRLAELQLERGGPVLPLARALLDGGVDADPGADSAAGSVVGASAAAVFHAAAVEAEPTEPALAARLYAAAAAAGRPLVDVAAGWAQAAARCADLDTALRLADQVIAEPAATGRAQAACVAAAALAHRGQRARSAELYRWAGTGSAVAFASVELIASGRLAEADKLVAADDGPPTMLAGATALLVDGVRQSVRPSGAGDPPAAGGDGALATLIRAATLLEPTGAAEVLPDSPAALAAIVALHRGELDIAESVLARAVEAGMGGALLVTRHRLLRAWIDMQRGRTAAAVDALTAVGAELAADGRAFEPRDALFAIGLEVGLARRDSDLPVLAQAWVHAADALVRHPVDLFALLPLGEFAVAAARLRDRARVRAHLADAGALLAALGDPPLWATPLHWSGLHAAIVAEEPDVADEHATALSAAGQSDRYAALLAAAARCWLAVLDGRIDADEVEAAARGLHGTGLCWDAARLAGQAAIRTSDRKAMVHLLDCARQLQGREIAGRQPASSASSGSAGDAVEAPEPEPIPAGSLAASLSARELEVAELAVDGLTYKEIGGRLFISAKTVEHHMARMRQKLGCTSRSELLAQLRQLAAVSQG